MSNIIEIILGNVKVELNSEYYPRGILQAGDYGFWVDEYLLQVEQNPFNLLKVCLRIYVGAEVRNICARYSEAMQRYVLENNSDLDIRAAIRACFTHTELKYNVVNETLRKIDEFCGEFALEHATEYLEEHASSELKEMYTDFKKEVA